MQEKLRQLYHHISPEEFNRIVQTIIAEHPEAWERWVKNKDEYYRQCKRHISYAVAHYASTTPIPPKDIEGTANLYFCIACLRWDPNGTASLPTYVAHQLGYLSGYLVGKEAKHKNNTTTVEVDGKKESILDLLGAVDPDSSLVDYIKKAGSDVLTLYTAINDGYYERKSKSGSVRPISAVGLYRSKVLDWNNLIRYENALKGLKQALDAWRYGKEYKGYARLMSA